MNADNQFDWVTFYKELAEKLLQYKDNRAELIEKVKKIYEMTGLNMPTLEKDNQLVDIDPFTVFGMFNKKLTDANRSSILTAIAGLFGITSPVPHSIHFFREDKKQISKNCGIYLSPRLCMLRIPQLRIGFSLASALMQRLILSTTATAK